MKKIILISLAIVVVCGIVVFLYFSNSPKNAPTGDDSLARVLESGTLVVGSNFPYGVMEFLDENSNPAGIDIEIAKEIATALDVEIKIVNYSWDDLFVAIKSGSIDLALSSISITQERSSEMLFSIPYFSSGQVLITKRTTTGIDSTNDILNKKIGVQEGTTAESGMEALGENLNITPYPTGPGLVQGLKDGTIDVIVTDYIEAITVVSENPELTIQGATFSQEFYGIATKLGNDTLMERVNEILRDLKRDGKILEIEKRFHNNAE